MGKREMPREELWGRDSPVWSRYYSSPGGIELGKEAEADLQQVWCDGVASRVGKGFCLGKHVLWDILCEADRLGQK